MMHVSGGVDSSITVLRPVRSNNVASSDSESDGTLNSVHCVCVTSQIYYYYGPYLYQHTSIYTIALCSQSYYESLTFWTSTPMNAATRVYGHFCDVINAETNVIYSKI